jgi:hypothetical protein
MKSVDDKEPSTQSDSKPKSFKTLGLLLATTCALLVTIGALNNGTAPTASVWDGLKTYIQTNLLGSTFVIMLALIALVVCVWQIAHGRGYGHVGTVLGVLALALLGPGLVDAAATATRDPMAVLTPAATSAPAAHAIHAQALLDARART